MRQLEDAWWEKSQLDCRKLGNKGAFWINCHDKIETAANDHFERKGISLEEKRHIANREKAYRSRLLWVDNFDSLLARWWQGVPKVLARTWQGVGILIAYSNQPFEYGYTMPSLCQHYAYTMASPWERLRESLRRAREIAGPSPRWGQGVTPFLSVPFRGCSVHPPWM